MRTRKTSPEVLYPDEPVVRVGPELVADLRAGAAASARQRMRFCAHRGSGDAVHEMIIVLRRGGYVRPHRHEGKSESFHVIAGEADVVLFDDAGAVRQVIELGEYASGKCFFYRLADPVYHTVLVRTDEFVIHETTTGPFDAAQTAFAPWSPADGDAGAVERYQAAIATAVSGRAERP